jgi:DNA-binding PadR family transcriptional regulator
MGLRHAVLAALCDEEYSGYQLAKAFDVGVANFWSASPQQLYSELTRLERDGLISGREVVQLDRPNKRVFTVTPAGLEELAKFAVADSKPLSFRDDLLVKIQVIGRLDPEPVIVQLEERAAEASAKLELFGQILRRLRGDLDERTFLRRGEQIGPYLTCLGGIRFQEVVRDWSTTTAEVLRQRRGTL